MTDIDKKIGEVMVAPLIPISTLNFDEPSEAVGRAVNENDKPNAATLFDRCIAELYGLKPYPRQEEAIRRAIFDAYALGGQAAKLEAETKHAALAQRSLEARLAVLMPTCITVAMDAAGMATMFVSNDDILTVRDRYALTTDVQEGGIQYSLVLKGQS